MRLARWQLSTVLGFAALAVLVAIGLLVVAWRVGGDGLALRSGPSVVTGVRDLSELATVEYHLERVIDLRDEQSLLFGLIRTEDAILFVAVGEVTAGVDLAQLRDSDVTVDRERNSVAITLPAPEVLSTRIDNDRSWVFARVTGVLARRQEDLETQARRQAERTLEQAAIDAGILASARTNAERIIEAFVRSLGYESVTIRFREEPGS